MRRKEWHMVKNSMLQVFGREFRTSLRKSEQAYDRIKGEKPKNRNAWIGKHAEQLWLESFAKHTGVLRRTVGIDPSSAVSNLGDPRRTDAVGTLVGGETAQFELKKSDYGGVRVENQLISQLFDLGLGTYGAETLNVIYGQNGRIDVYTREQGEAIVSAAMKEGGEAELPAPAKTIQFAPDVIGKSKSM
jgi:hypothetical protein